jgi:hypothetical protein
MCDIEFISWRASETHCINCQIFNWGYNAYRTGRKCEPPQDQGLTEYGFKLWRNGYLAAAQLAEDENQAKIREQVEIAQAVDRLIAVSTDPVEAERQRVRERKQFAREAQSTISQLTANSLTEDPSESMIARQQWLREQAERQEFAREAQIAIDAMCGNAEANEPARGRLARLLRFFKRKR